MMPRATRLQRLGLLWYYQCCKQQQTTDNAKKDSIWNLNGRAHDNKKHKNKTTIKNKDAKKAKMTKQKQESSNKNTKEIKNKKAKIQND